MRLPGGVQIFGWGGTVLSFHHPHDHPLPSPVHHEPSPGGSPTALHAGEVWQDDIEAAKEEAEEEGKEEEAAVVAARPVGWRALFKRMLPTHFPLVSLSPPALTFLR